MSTPKMLLIDGNNLGHRIWHSCHRDISAWEVWGFTLSRLRRELGPTHAVAVFDGQGPTWRHALWPSYKSKRDGDSPSRPSADTWAKIHAECDAYRMARVQIAGVEADDVIASYVAAATKREIDVVIVSLDKDLMQLLRDGRPQVRQLDVKHNLMGPAEVMAKFRVWPHAIPDLLALAGDTADNFPGIEGIGPKTAATLINEHGDVEQILERVNLLPVRWSNRVRESAERLRLFRRLAELRSDLDLPIPIERTRWERR